MVFFFLAFLMLITFLAFSNVILGLKGASMKSAKSFFTLSRVHLFEIEDQTWCPKSLRDGVTDFLQHIVQAFSVYRPIAQKLVGAVYKSGQSQVLDLCSGGTGPWKSLVGEFDKANNDLFSIVLTDLYPNELAFKSVYQENDGSIQYLKTPVNALDVPKNLLGFRTFFSSFHHLKPCQAQTVLQNAVEAKSGIAIFESTQRHSLMILYMLFVAPLLVLALTPFIRPFRWSRLFLTYVIPLIPLVICFDGVVSCFRTYSVDELKQMTNSINDSDYHWESGVENMKGLPFGITYLIGYPKK